MSWPLNTIELWVTLAMVKIGCAQSVCWLQQRDAPGVAAMAQHIDFLSAYELTPKHRGDEAGQCPITLGQSLLQKPQPAPQTFTQVRQPLLLIPFLAKSPGTVTWNNTEIPFSNQLFSIPFERKSLRDILIVAADVHWSKSAEKASDSATPLLEEVPARNLMYVKTLQHYAGTLPPPVPVKDDPDPS